MLDNRCEGVGPWKRQQLASLKEEALASLDSLAVGLWLATRPHMHEDAENAVLRAQSWPEIAGTLRRWENGHIRGWGEWDGDLEQVITRDFGIPRRQRRAET